MFEGHEPGYLAGPQIVGELRTDARQERMAAGAARGRDGQRGRSGETRRSKGEAKH